MNVFGVSDEHHHVGYIVSMIWLWEGSLDFLTENSYLVDLFRNKVELQWLLVTHSSIDKNIFSDQFTP